MTNKPAFNNIFLSNGFLEVTIIERDEIGFTYTEAIYSAKDLLTQRAQVRKLQRKHAAATKHIAKLKHEAHDEKIAAEILHASLAKALMNLKFEHNIAIGKLKLRNEQHSELTKRLRALEKTCTMQAERNQLLEQQLKDADAAYRKLMEDVRHLFSHVGEVATAYAINIEHDSIPF